jgi:hypothetical protein
MYSQIEQAHRLVAHLERLSADSYWAHRASGLRGALMRSLERLENGDGDEREETARLSRLFERGFEILRRAAREIPG